MRLAHVARSSSASTPPPPRSSSSSRSAAAPRARARVALLELDLDELRHAADRLLRGERAGGVGALEFDDVEHAVEGVGGLDRLLLVELVGERLEDRAERVGDVRLADGDDRRYGHREDEALVRAGEARRLLAAHLVGPLVGEEAHARLDERRGRRVEGRAERDGVRVERVEREKLPSICAALTRMRRKPRPWFCT